VRRVLKLSAFLVAALPLGGLALAALFAWLSLRKVRAAAPTWRPSWRVLLWARVWAAVYRIRWPFFLAILHNEGASTPRTLRAAEIEALGVPPWLRDSPETGYPVGDLDVSKGPSVGAGQVLRSNIVKLWGSAGALRWLVATSNPLALARVGEERRALWASAKVLRGALDEAKGDENLAARFYNGGAHYNADAVTYAERADAFAEAVA
jgi:hypothetical protein